MIKNLKLSKILFIVFSFLLCFVCFFSFFPLKTAKADELYPNPSALDTYPNYLLNLEQVSLVNGLGNDIIDIDYPRPLYPDKIKSLNESGYNTYYNKRVLGVTRGGVQSDITSPIDIFFSCNSDNATSLGDLSIKRLNWSYFYSVPFYKSNSYISLTPFRTSNIGVVCSFADSLIPLGEIVGTTVKNSPILNNRGFYIYYIASGLYDLEVEVSYRYFYNLDEPPTGGGVVTPLSEYQLTERFFNYYTFHSNDNGVAGGLVYNPIFSNFSAGSQYYLYGNFGFCYRYITDLTITATLVKTSNLAVNPTQVSFTNYSFVLNNSDKFTLFDSISLNGFNSDNFYDFNIGSFLASAVGGFLEFELFPGFTLTGLLAITIAIPLTIAVLKFFAGG